MSEFKSELDKGLPKNQYHMKAMMIMLTFCKCADRR